MTYIAPSVDLSAFHCPNSSCGVYAAQSWYQVTGRHASGAQQSLRDVRAALCTHCSSWSLWIRGELVDPPHLIADPPHVEMPADCKADFDEARAIFAKSKRGSAALLRLVVQKLMVHLGQPGQNLNADIAALVKDGLPVLIQQALDACRVIGNHAVHPGELNVRDDAEIAGSLFGLVNAIVEDRIARPKAIQATYEKIPAGLRAAIEKRDS